MTKKKLTLLLSLALLSVVSASALTIKVGSPFPEGSPWDLQLKKMAGEWSDLTKGEVRLRIYPGGVAGNEDDMIRKMRIGQIDLAVLTSFGVKSIVPETFLIALPGLARDDKEVDYLLENVIHRYDDKFREAGFENLSWSKAGWAYFFSKKPIVRPQDLKSLKLSVSSTDSEVAAIFKELGFNVIPLSLNELMVSLQSGLAESYYAPPIASAAFQWFALSPHMLNFKLAPVFGAMVISKRTWDRVPKKYQSDLKAILDKVNLEFSAEAERLNKEALKVMLENDLTVQDVTEEQRMEWFDLFAKGSRLVVGDGKWVSTQAYDALYKELADLREDM